MSGIWKPLYDRFGIHIDFTHRTFRWDSEASLKAHVHCVIVGFSATMTGYSRLIFTSDRPQQATNINAYLIDGPDVFINSRRSPVCRVPEMTNGNKAVDGGNLFLTPEEKALFLQSEPTAEKYVRQVLGAEEYINGKLRYCIWFAGASPSDLRQMPEVMRRVSAIRAFRLNSTKADTRKSAETPALFQQIR